MDDPVGEVVEAADPPRGDERDPDRVGDGPGEGEVEAVPGPVPVHAGEQDLPRPEGFHPRAPLDRVEAGRAPPAVGVDLPPRLRRALAPLPRVDRDHDALGADLARRVGDEARVRDRRGVDGDLVRPRVEEPADVPDLADPAPHGEGDEDLARHRLDHVDQGVAFAGGGGDVEEGELVRPLLVVAPRGLDRVAGVHDVDEADALHHPPGVHVEARDDARGEPHQPSLPFAPRRAGSPRSRDVPIPGKEEGDPFRASSRQAERKGPDPGVSGESLPSNTPDGGTGNDSPATETGCRSSTALPDHLHRPCGGMIALWALAFLAAFLLAPGAAQARARQCLPRRPRRRPPRRRTRPVRIQRPIRNSAGQFEVQLSPAV